MAHRTNVPMGPSSRQVSGYEFGVKDLPIVSPLSARKAAFCSSEKLNQCTPRLPRRMRKDTMAESFSL